MQTIVRYALLIPLISAVEFMFRSLAHVEVVGLFFGIAICIAVEYISFMRGVEHALTVMANMSDEEIENVRRIMREAVPDNTNNV